MNSFTGIFWQHFKSPHAPPCIDLSLPPSNFEEPNPPCSQHLWKTLDRKTQCVCIHVYQIIKNWGHGPYNSLCHANNRKYFSGLSLMGNWRETHMFYLAREVGKFGHVLAEKKVTKYGQTWKIYSTFKNGKL